MTVKELREKLAELPDDFLVVFSKDAEGNEFRPVHEVDQGQYEPTAAWYGVYYVEDQLEQDDDPIQENAVCLWPIN